MILGMTAFTFFHVVLSLVGILSGFVVVGGFLTAKRSNGWTLSFLTSTLLTSVTGFLFPFHKFLPSHGVGSVSLLVLAVTISALYVFHLPGPWRRAYVIGAVISLYLYLFFLIAPFFIKVSALNALSPTQSQPPFLRPQVW